MSNKKFVVTGPLRHDGEDQELGATVSMTEKDAGPLLDAGAIGRPSDPKTQALLADVKERLAAEEAARKERERQQRELEAAEEKRKQDEADERAQRLEDEAADLRAKGGADAPGTPGQTGSAAGVGGVNAINNTPAGTGANGT